MNPQHGDGAGRDSWTVVCVGCLRIKRGGRWTDEYSPDTKGVSTGFCDRCVKLERKRQRSK